MPAYRDQRAGVLAAKKAAIDIRPLGVVRGVTELPHSRCPAPMSRTSVYLQGSPADGLPVVVGLMRCAAIGGSVSSSS